MTQSQPFTVLGAYTLASGLTAEQQQRLYAQVPSLGVDALEIPVQDFLAGAERTDLSEFSPLDIGLDLVVTFIPTVMEIIEWKPKYGLASTDEEFRGRAVRDVVEVFERIDRLVVSANKGRVRALHVHSAPRRAHSSEQALESSLREILAVAPQGVDVVLEHCDAQRDGQTFVKGFLELDEELAVVQRINDPRLGIAINWGRSAIEGRSAQYVTDQIEKVAATGLLRGLMFSGVASEPGPWGQAWEDSHLAPRADQGILAQNTASLLGADEIKAALYAAGSQNSRAYTGAKVTVAHSGASLDDRIETAQRTLSLIVE